jgi:transposase
METGGLVAVKHEEKVVPERRVKELEKRIRQLERMLGRQTLHNEILKEAVKIGREKKLISRQPLPGLEDFE